jgi:putative nucleotidyltransferase with HDIG domain
VLSLVTALSAHDRRTRGHAERVRIFADMLAEQFKLSEQDRDRLRWAALLHDIGKLSVTSRILNKPGKLDPAEWELMSAHPAEGARIAEPLMAWLGHWGRAIAEHHERYDGAGYPAGLTGERISVGARMISVVDAYDTMTAARSYRRPVATRRAREELARCAGTQFDPVMVREFLAISVPRLVWVTGPASFLVQAPYLWELQRAAGQAAVVMAQTAATGAVVTAAAVTMTGPLAVAQHAGAGTPFDTSVSSVTASGHVPGAPGSGDSGGKGQGPGGGKGSGSGGEKGPGSGRGKDQGSGGGNGQGSGGGKDQGSGGGNGQGSGGGKGQGSGGGKGQGPSKPTPAPTPTP